MRQPLSLLPSLLAAGLLAQSQQPTAPRIPRDPMVGGDHVTSPLLGKSETATDWRPAPVPVLAPTKLPVEPVSSDANMPFARPDWLLFDQPQAGGALWAAARSFKASFARDSWSFVPFFGSEAPRNYPIEFTAPRARLGGEDLPTAVATPKQRGQRIEYDRGSFVEAFDVRSSGIEQTFRFDRLPTRGDLVLSIALRSDLVGTDVVDGIRFGNQIGSVSYGEAVAIDASGIRVHAETQFDNGTITITVPAAFVAKAQLPLLIDPWIASNFAATSAAFLSNSDVAWDEGQQRTAVCHQLQFSAQDYDCYVALMDSALTVQSTVVVDTTFYSWTLPKIASNRLVGVMLVVAQVSYHNVAPSWIMGRTLNGLGGSAAQFDIERSGVAGHVYGNKFNPDVGGDPFLSGPTYFTVVWAHEAQPGNHDIYMKQVTVNSTLRSAVPTLLAGSVRNESNPSISNSDGAVSAQLQRWAVVFQMTYSPTDEDLQGSLITWDGQVMTIAGSSVVTIDGSGANTTAPSVSSPTDGNSRMFLVACEVPLSLGGVRLLARDFDLGLLWSSDVASLEGSVGHAANPKRAPKVDCDGVRFTVAYQEAFNASSDWDIRAMLVAYHPSFFLAAQETVDLAATAGIELFPGLTSHYAGSGVRSTRCSVSLQSGSAGTFAISAVRYDAHAQGGVTSRATSCGSLAISWTGETTIGQHIAFSLAQPHPLTGFVFGTMLSAPIGPCPGCTLGVDGFLIIGNQLDIDIPPNAALVGAALSTQGFTFAAGPCLGEISLSDTLDWLIR